MASRLQATVSSLLRPTEKLTATAEVFFMNRQHLRRKRVVSVIIDSQGLEGAILVHRFREDGSLEPMLALSILGDTRVSLVEEKLYDDTVTHVLRLTAAGVELRLETPLRFEVMPVVSEIERLIKIAQDKHYSAFPWVNFYATSNSLYALSQHTSSLLLSPPSTPHYTSQSTIPSIPQHYLAQNPLVSFAAPVPANNVSNIKATYISKEMGKREHEFSGYEKWSVLVGTWNVNNRLPTDSLAPWLRSKQDDNNYDLIVLGFQELDLSPEAFLYYDNTRELAWSRAIEAGIGAKSQEYVKVASRQLIGMLIIIYAKRIHLPYISDVQTDAVGTGFMGVGGNKGAVYVRLRVHDSWLCFVNSHLAADTAQLERRNQDFWEIVKKIQFVADETDLVTPCITSAAAGIDWAPVKLAPGVASIVDHDHVIWMGDLNYRVALSDIEVKDMLRQGRMYDLMQFDQLTGERSSRRVFSDFTEGSVTFLPTYKYDVGTSIFDTSEKRRAPSWTDRILWLQHPMRRSDAEWITQSEYTSVMEMMISDHKPVRSIMKMKIRKVNQDKMRTVHKTILRELDKFENASIPLLTISTHSLCFGNVSLMVPYTETFHLENRGHVIAQFSVTASDATRTQRWTWVEPSEGLLAPGERITVRVTVYIQIQDAHKFMSVEERVEEIFVVSIHGGKDMFLTLNGDLLSTCFGVDIGILCLPRSVRPSIRSLGAIGVAKLKEKYFTSGNVVTDSKVKLTISHELKRMVEFIETHSTQEDLLFVEPGDSILTAYLRECLDCDETWDVEWLLTDPESVLPISTTRYNTHTTVVNGDHRKGEMPTSTTSDTVLPGFEELSAPPGIVDYGLLSEPTKLVPSRTTSAYPETQSPSSQDNHFQGSTISNSRPNQPDTVNANKVASDTTREAIAKPPRSRCGRSNTIASICETLVRFLDALPEPLIPFSFYTRCTQQGYRSSNDAVSAVDGLDKYLLDVWMYLMAFLGRVSRRTAGANAEVLAMIFAPVLLKAPASTNSTKAPSTKTSTTTSTSNTALYPQLIPDIPPPLPPRSTTQATSKTGQQQVPEDVRKRRFVQWWIEKGVQYDKVLGSLGTLTI